MAPNGTDPLDEYPRQYARTKRFTLGSPRTFTVSPDGRRVVFLRSNAGDDTENRVWVFDVEAGEERLLFDPTSAGADETAETDAERAMRERVGEQASGVTSYSTDRDVRRAVFALGAATFVLDLVTGEARTLPIEGPVDDPRLDPTGARVAYVREGALRVLDLDGEDRLVASDDDPNVSWGLADFIAAEEMHRFHGHWWSPDGDRLAAVRVDETPVQVWHISDPADPAKPSRPIRYPPAGSDNAITTLHVVDVATGDRVEVSWDRETYPYLARVGWGRGSPLTILVQTRDQRTIRVLQVDDSTGATSVVAEDRDPQWVDLPMSDDAIRRLDDGRLVRVRSDRDADTNRLVVGDEMVTPPGLQVRSVASAGADVLFVASGDDPTSFDVWRWSPDGLEQVSDRPGIHAATSGGGVTVLTSATLDEPTASTTILRDGEVVARLASQAETPVVRPAPRFLSLGERALRAALLVPGGRGPDGPLPVLLDPYGGPHGPRVLRSSAAFNTPQWFADQGMAVLVIDGRGTSGRGPAWDREMYRDFTIALADQVDGLHAAADGFPFLDLSRVAIRGWSFGGELAAMAILRRPDVFHAAIAGAPVTDQRLYDTHYTERYLGDPNEEPEAYERSSVLADASRLERPLLLIHGLADDNVVAAHTLKLSAALFEAGRRHELTILPSATHRQTSDEALLRLQVDFLRRHLGLDRSS
jgi:dipeptidyl-peptidase-4